MKDVVYQTSGYHRALWRQHKVENSSALVSEINAVRRYDRFDAFAGEIYGRMFAGGAATPVVEPPPGMEVYRRFAEQLDDVPEMDDLARRCQGEEWFTGLATQGLIDDLLAVVPAPDHPVVDVDRDDETLQALRDLLAEYEQRDDGQEAVAEIEDAIAEIEGARAARAQHAAQVAALLDETTVRNAYRSAARNVRARIEQEVRMRDAFAAGQGQHSGRHAQRAVAAKLRELVAVNDRLRRIAELAGRLRRIAMERQARKPRKGTDEVTGVELGADLGRVLPVEMATAEGAWEAAFARRFSERALLQQELSSPPPREQGPIIVLLDSSGSMKINSADAWAAAVTLAYLEIARKQRRAFAIVHFGAEVLRTDRWLAGDAWDPVSIAEAVNFFAADAGTNFEAPLGCAVKIIEQEGEYRDADVVLITDGKAPITADWLASHRRQKAQLCFRTYAILVGPATRLDTVQDVADEVVYLADALRDDPQMHHLFERV